MKKSAKYISQRATSNLHTKSMVDLDLISATFSKPSQHKGLKTEHLNQTQQPNNASLSQILAQIAFNNNKHRGISSQRFDIDGGVKKSKIKTKNGNISKHIKEQKEENGKQSNYGLMVRLKQYIESLKKKEQEYINRIKQLEVLNEKLENKCQKLENEVKHNKIQELEEKRKQNRIEGCHMHDITIKSLKKVIDQQISKIIELEREKLQLAFNAENHGEQSLKGQKLQDYFEKCSENSKQNDNKNYLNTFNLDRFDASFSETPKSYFVNSIQEDQRQQGSDLLLEMNNYIKKIGNK